MDFKDFTIYLCRTSHPGNIGSTARAMQTMGFENLSLINPKQFPADEATALASMQNLYLKKRRCLVILKQLWQSSIMSSDLPLEKGN